MTNQDRCHSCMTFQAGQMPPWGSCRRCGHATCHDHLISTETTGQVDYASGAVATQTNRVPPKLVMSSAMSDLMHRIDHQCVSSTSKPGEKRMSAIIQTFFLVWARQGDMVCASCRADAVVGIVGPAADHELELNQYWMNQLNRLGGSDPETLRATLLQYTRSRLSYVHECIRKINAGYQRSVTGAGGDFFDASLNTCVSTEEGELVEALALSYWAEAAGSSHYYELCQLRGSGTSFKVNSGMVQPCVVVGKWAIAADGSRWRCPTNDPVGAARGAWDPSHAETTYVDSLRSRRLKFQPDMVVMRSGSKPKLLAKNKSDSGAMVKTRWHKFNFQSVTMATSDINDWLSTDEVVEMLRMSL